MPASKSTLYCLAAVALFTLSACTQTVGHFTPAVASNPDDSMFYIYRPEPSQPGLMKPLKFDYPEVLIDGQSIGVLKYNEYLVTELTPGAHDIRITGLTTASRNWAERDIEQVIRPGQQKQVYMKLMVEYDTEKMNLAQMGPKYIIRLIPVDPENALYEIRNTRPAGK